MFWRWRRRRYQDFDEEIKSHISLEIDRLLSEGFNEQDARAQASRTFGNAAAARERFYESGRIAWFDRLSQDVRFAVRSLKNKPLLAAIVILTLGIGVGANTAMFSVIDAVLLRPLPYKNSNRLVAIWGEAARNPGSKLFASYGDFQQLRAKAQSFEDVAAETWAGSSDQILRWRDEAYHVGAFPVSDNLFSLLGTHPILGRTFTPADMTRECAVIVSQSLWKDRLGGTSEILNTNLSLSNKSCTVVGVMPDFTFYPRNDGGLWTLITLSSNLAKNPAGSVAIFARLKPNVMKEAAEAEAAALHEAVSNEAAPDSWVRSIRPKVYDLQQEFTWLAGRNLKAALWMLFGAVGAVLLIACVNISGLLTSQAATREKEFAVRAALGSGRPRIVRQLLTESVLLTAGGTCLGCTLAVVGVWCFRTLNPIELPPGNPVKVNVAVLAFTALVAVAAGFAFGLVPALRACRIDLNQGLKATSLSTSRSLLSSRSGKAFVIFEVALSMTLVLASGLLIKSIRRLTVVPMGFRTDQLLVAYISLPVAAYTNSDARSALYAELMRRSQAVPGIEDVAISSNRPLTGSGSSVVSIAGKPAPTSEVGDIWTEQVSHNYFRSLGIPVLLGREFDSRDTAAGEQVAVVNQRFVQEYFSSEDPIGKQIKLGMADSNNPWLTIVGVVGNLQHTTVYKEMGYVFDADVYRPITQQSGSAMWLFARIADKNVNVIPALQHATRDTDGRIPVLHFESMDEIISRNVSHPRFRTVLLSTFAAIALFLSAIGLYGVLNHTVLQQAKEIGIRAALGAKRRDILSLFVARGLILTVTGTAVGLIASLYGARFFSSMLYETPASDAPTLLLTSGVLLVVTTIAIYLPARRASRVDPIVALKHE